MSKKKSSEIRRERREGTKPEVDTGAARKELRNAVVVAIIIFLGVWLVLFLVASEKNMFGPLPEENKRHKFESDITTTFPPAIPAADIATYALFPESDDTSGGC